jgi:hypothetical protein
VLARDSLGAAALEASLPQGFEVREPLFDGHGCAGFA